MGLMKKLTSVLVASSLVLGSVGMALAAPTEEQVNASFERLAAYEIVKGRLLADGTTDPALGEPITRAELLKVIVMGLGYTEAQVNILKGAASFDDVDLDQWYAPYVALAKNIAEQNGFEVGYPDGTFRPNNQVTAIEALVFVMKLLGITPVTGENWIQGNINLAVQNGVITSADAEALLDAATEPANRGLAFAIVDTAFITYAVDGKNVYQRFVDKEAPGLTVDATPASVQAATITITGTVTGASELYAGSDAITFDGEGKFSYEAALEVGQNTITLTAKDIVGNVTTVDVVVERTVGAANAVVIEIAEQIVAGSEAEMKISVTDATGAPVEIDEESLTVTIGGEIGSYEDGVFKASEKAGKGTITVTYGDLEAAVAEIEIVPGPLATVEAEKPSVAPGEAVKLLAKDKYGNVIEGAVFSENEANAMIEGDTFIATKPGSYKVTATVGEESIEATIGVFGEVAGFKIEAPKAMVANGETKYTITVTAVDEAGNPVSDFDGDVTLTSDLDLTKATVKAENGVAKFEAKVPVGLEEIELDLVASYEDIESETTITAVAQVATKLSIKADEYLGINEKSPAFTGTVKVLDQEGVAMKTGDSWEVTLKVSGPAYLNEDKDTEDILDVTGDGEEFDLVPRDSRTEGDVIITATAAGLESATATVKAAYAYEPDKVVVSSVSTAAVKANDKAVYVFKIGFVDRNGVPVLADDDYKLTLEFDTTAGDEISINHSDAKADVDDVAKITDSLIDGNKYEIDVAKDADYIFVGVTAKKLVGEIDVTASVSGLKSGKGTVAFKADDVAGIAFKADSLNVLPNADTEISFQLVDGAGNKAPGAYKVQLTSDDDDVLKLNGKSKVVVTTDETGKGVVKAKAAAYSGTYKLTAVVDANKDGDYDDVGSDDFEAELGLTVVAAVPKIISVSTYDENGNRKTSFNSGEEIEIRVTLTDNNGLNLGGLYVGDLKLTGIAYEKDIKEKEADVPDFVWHPDGYWYTTVTAWKAGTVNFKVTDNSVAADVEGGRAVVVRAGEAYGFAVKEAVSGVVKIKSGKVTPLTVQVVDEAGNVVSASEVRDGVEVTATLSAADGTLDGEYMIVRDTEVGGGTHTATITVKKATFTLWVVTDTENEDLKLDLTTSDFSPGTGSVTLTVEKK